MRQSLERDAATMESDAALAAKGDYGEQICRLQEQLRELQCSGETGKEDSK